MAEQPEPAGVWESVAKMASTGAPWWIQNAVLPGGLEEEHDSSKAIFSDRQQNKFGIDAAGKVLNQPKFDAALACVKRMRQDVALEEVALDDFSTWRAHICNADEVVHVKGFRQGMDQSYDLDALELLSDYSLLVWDGDDYEETGFTKLVPRFLRARPTARAVAFQSDHMVDDLRESWASVVAQFPGRISVVPLKLQPPNWVDASRFGIAGDAEKASSSGLPEWAQEDFLRGRLALSVTGSKRVISLGGDSIVSHEARLSVNCGIDWIIYALSRGKKEKIPTLMDWAVSQANLKLVRGKDANEADAFAQVRESLGAEGGA